MSTCEHQGRDTVLQTGLKIHWSRRSASSCFNRVWNVTISSAKHQSMLRPWVLQHQPWPSPSAWTKTRSLHGCRNFYLLILPSLSFSLSFSLSLLLLILDRSDVCSPLLCVFRLNFAPKLTCRAKRKEVLIGARRCVLHTGLSELFLFMCRSASVASRLA